MNRLDSLVQDARAATDEPAIDWAKVEADLFGRALHAAAAEHEASLAAQTHFNGVRGVRWIAAGTLAAAAALVFMLGHGTDRGDAADARDGYVLLARGPRVAGTLEGIGARGGMRVDGRPVTGGALHEGERIETSEDGALVQTPRDGNARAIRWAVEPHGVVNVTSVASGLVLSLGTGAIEADVMPVEAGEALAIDVGDTRVAIHGTHLRVARTGDHVVVDLSEGVIAIGVPPRSGTTTGTVLAAPAHAEFDVGHRETSLVVSHARKDVRAPALTAPSSPVPSPASSARSSVEATTLPSEKSLAREGAEGAMLADASLTLVGNTTDLPERARSERPALDHAPPAGARVNVGGTAAAGNAGSASTTNGPNAARNAGGSATSTGSALLAIDPRAAQSIAEAVVACTKPSLSGAGIVVSIQTRLTLGLEDDGRVRIARFEPPLFPAAQECAARTIYLTRFDRSTNPSDVVVIPIEIRPSP